MSHPSPREVLAICREKEIQAVNLRFMDFPGAQKQFTIPVDALTEQAFEDGFSFDGYAIRGWQAINESDMLVVPESTTATVDPFISHSLAMFCHIQDPVTRQNYLKDPRFIARKAESYLRSTGIGDDVRIRPEAEFFVFDHVRFEQNEHQAYYHIESQEAHWSRGDSQPAGNTGHNAGYKIRPKEGYFPVPPADTLQQIRTEIMLALQDCGVPVEGHHHEVASAGQCEVDIRAGSLQQTADRVALYKYIVRNVAAKWGKTATFMPKPIFGDNGSGLHLGLSLWKGGQNQFAGSGYGGLSEVAMWAIGGILHHAWAILAFCCPTTNSYKRLVPGFEAPVNLSYSSRNRSAAVRIPAHSPGPDSRGFEFRCPDSSANSHFAMSAVLMAMIDGVQNRRDPGRPLDKDLYDLPPEERRDLPRTPRSLEEALDALEKDHDFLLRGDVFTADVIEAWIGYKRERECEPLRQRPHPFEFILYYDV